MRVEYYEVEFGMRTRLRDEPSRTGAEPAGLFEGLNFLVRLLPGFDRHICLPTTARFPPRALGVVGPLSCHHVYICLYSLLDG